MFAYNKIIMALMVLCFAILQALLPFIHGHLDLAHPIQETGLHLSHDIDELNHSKYHAPHNTSEPDFAEHGLSAHMHSVHTVTIESGIKQEIDIAVTVDIAAFVILLFCFLQVLFTRQQHYLPYLLVNKKSAKRLLPAPRAPPYRS